MVDHSPPGSLAGLYLVVKLVRGMNVLKNRSRISSWIPPLIGCILIWGIVGIASGAPANWIRNEDGLIPSTAYDPYFIKFGNHIYIVTGDGLYVQLYNQPCFGWQEVYCPTGASGFTPAGDYLYANTPDLWWIQQGNYFSSENWHQVTSSGLPAGSEICPWTVFDGQLYGVVTYFPSGSSWTTFDIYRTPDIGKTTMTWSKVVSEGFFETQNHKLGYLGVFNNKIIAISTETHNGLFGDTAQYLDGIEAWESSTGDFGSWSQVNVDGFGTRVIPPDVGANCNFGAAEIYNGQLYVGTKTHFGAEVWRYDGSGTPSGWTDVTPPTLGIYFGGGPGRVQDMAVFGNSLYVAEGYPTANLVKYNGASWTVVEAGNGGDGVPDNGPFSSENSALVSMVVYPSQPLPPSPPTSETGDKLLISTHVWAGGYQIWQYPFSTTPLTCSKLKSATISVSPKTATNTLHPGQTHTVTATVNAGSGADFSGVWIPCSFQIYQYLSSSSGLGFVGTNGQFGALYGAVQGPGGIYTDTITMCFSNSETNVCDSATKTWVAPKGSKGVFRPSSPKNWILDREMDGTIDVRDHYGISTDKPLVGDFNNDGTPDRAVFRASSWNNWIIDYSIDGSVNALNHYGGAGDVPFVGDFNNDMINDRAVFRNGEWIFDWDMDGDVDVRNIYGTNGDVPLVADFNNDGIFDRAVFRPSAWDNWIFDYSMDGTVDLRNHYGSAGDAPVAGFFNGDMITDRAVFRNGEWIMDYNLDGSVDARPVFGTMGDKSLVWMET